MYLKNYFLENSEQKPQLHLVTTLIKTPQHSRLKMIKIMRVQKSKVNILLKKNETKSPFSEAHQ